MGTLRLKVISWSNLNNCKYFGNWRVFQPTMFISSLQRTFNYILSQCQWLYCKARCALPSLHITKFLSKLKRIQYLGHPSISILCGRWILKMSTSFLKPRSTTKLMYMCKTIHIEFAGNKERSFGPILLHVSKWVVDIPWPYVIRILSKIDFTLYSFQCIKTCRN